jgi:hypothetical protein
LVVGLTDNLAINYPITRLSNYPIIHYSIGPFAYLASAVAAPPTLTVMSAVDDNAPSLAVARKT